MTRKHQPQLHIAILPKCQTQPRIHISNMVDVARVQPQILRIAVAVTCILGVFLFFDPIGYISTSTVPGRMVPGETRTVTHVVLFQFKRNADHAAIDVVCLLPHTCTLTLGD